MSRVLEYLQIRPLNEIKEKAVLPLRRKIERISEEKKREGIRPRAS
jgi:hypothetical protein